MRKKGTRVGKRRKERRRETWDLFVFSLVKRRWKMAWFVAIDPLNSASRIKRQFVKHGIKSLIKKFREKESFSKRDDEGIRFREERHETGGGGGKKKKEKNMEYIINEIFQDLFKLSSKWIFSSVETFQYFLWILKTKENKYRIRNGLFEFTGRNL